MSQRNVTRPQRPREGAAPWVGVSAPRPRGWHVPCRLGRFPAAPHSGLVCRQLQASTWMRSGVPAARAVSYRSYECSAINLISKSIKAPYRDQPPEQLILRGETCPRSTPGYQMQGTHLLVPSAFSKPLLTTPSQGPMSSLMTRATVVNPFCPPNSTGGLEFIRNFSLVHLLCSAKCLGLRAGRS